MPDGTIEFILTHAYTNMLIVRHEVAPPYAPSASYGIFRGKQYRVSNPTPRNIWSRVAFHVRILSHTGKQSHLIYFAWPPIPRVVCCEMRVTCSFCFDDDSDDVGLRIESCEHCFHFECLSRWLRGTCPNCRGSMFMTVV